MRTAWCPGAVTAGHAAFPEASVDRFPRGLGRRRVQPNLGNAQTYLVLLRSADGAMRERGADETPSAFLLTASPERDCPLRGHHGLGNFFPETSVDTLFLEKLLSGEFLFLLELDRGREGSAAVRWGKSFFRPAIKNHE